MTPSWFTTALVAAGITLAFWLPALALSRGRPTRTQLGGLGFMTLVVWLIALLVSDLGAGPETLEFLSILLAVLFSIQAGLALKAYFSRGRVFQKPYERMFLLGSLVATPLAWLVVFLELLA